MVCTNNTHTPATASGEAVVSRPRDLAGPANPPVLDVVEGTPFPRSTAEVLAFANGEMHRETYGVTCESELTIVANGQRLVKLLCSKADLRELAYGFLLTEGVISSLDQVLGCTVDDASSTAEFELSVDVRKPDCPVVTSGFGGRALQGTGFAGRAASEPYVPPAPDPALVGRVQDAMRAMKANARGYQVTRGLHCSALFAGNELLACYEDIGRHNTFDKLAGHCLLQGIACGGTLLTTTGRVSGEMARKALKLGVAGIASFSGPTDASLALAREAGILLVGYVGDSSAVVYVAPQHETPTRNLRLV